MSATKKRSGGGQEHGAAWFGVMLDLLRGGVIGAAVAILILLAASVLIWCGAVRSTAGSMAAVLACALGALTAGWIAVGRGSSGRLLRGLGAGVVLFLMLLSVGALIGDGAPAAHTCGAIPAACLCGGGASALLAGRFKKKRRRVRGG